MDECRAENCKAKHPHKRFCVNGHDTFECGREANHQCSECNREHLRKRWRTPEYRERHRERQRRRYWSDHEYRFERRRVERERNSPHIWTASKEVV